MSGLTYDATLRNLELIGEAATHIRTESQLMTGGEGHCQELPLIRTSPPAISKPEPHRKPHLNIHNS